MKKDRRSDPYHSVGLLLCFLGAQCCGAVHEIVDAERPAVGGLILFHAAEGNVEIVFLRVLGQVCPEPGVKKVRRSRAGEAVFYDA